MDFSWDSATGRAIITIVVIAAAWGLLALAKLSVRRLVDDRDQRFNAGRLLRILVWIVVAVALVFIWQPLGGSLGPALGLAAAGLAFAMQEVIGAVAGWFNITFGRVFRVGDRVQMAGVHGDVIDISLLKTRMMEVGSSDSGAWVEGRQYTGRVVSISNKATFTEPVFNYSSYFDYIWDEVQVAIPHHGDWRLATEILRDEARAVSDSEGAREAMEEVRRRFPVPAAEVLPRVYAIADETHVRLAVRFVVPIRTARQVKDRLIRAAYGSLAAAGIEVVSTNVVQSAAELWRPVEPADPPAND